MGPSQEYSDLMVQFGFTLLFVSAFPFGCVLGFFLAFAQYRLDIHKYLVRVKRPVPVAVESIGSWVHVLRFILVAAVMTNAGLIAFTTHSLRNSVSYHLW